MGVVDGFEGAGVGALREQQANKRTKHGDAITAVYECGHEVYFLASLGWGAQTLRVVEGEKLEVGFKIAVT
ncbi:hypothetical protein D3C85_1492800 [compost metagenome]